MFTLRPERPADAAAIEDLLDRAFGPDRHTKTSYRYRQGRPPEPGLSWVAVDEAGRLVGTIRGWKVAVGGAPALLLGPLAVAPELRGAGIGRALVRHFLRVAAAEGHGPVLLVGDPLYYAQFGFAAAGSAVVMPGERPGRLLTVADATRLAGVVEPWSWVRRPVSPGQETGLSAVAG